ncbi:MAG: hypothetical protein HYX96_02445 [Chloroflexi bacterium]|nr:hypothetical protein [Chloroflexota bacterium]
MTASLLSSAATFRRALPEKFSFVLLNQLDLVLTVIAISLGFSELNPWMRGWLESPPQLLLFKAVAPLFIAWLVPGKLLLPSILLLGLVLGWDIKELVAGLA